MSLFQAIIIAIVEGLTEFLPISSTGHMILTSALLGLENNEFLKTFEIAIQLGAILAIALMYIKRFFTSLEIYYKLIIAFLPTALIGFLSYGIIKNYLFSPWVVCISLIIGGIILLIIDKKILNSESIHVDLHDITYKQSFFIGLIQSISIIPGVSRAGATIVGGVFNGLNKTQATEFSFLLAVPTMFAATSYELIKTPIELTKDQLTLLLAGSIVAFITAWIAVKLLLIIVSKSGFFYFAWYRIFIGIIFIILLYLELI